MLAKKITSLQHPLVKHWAELRKNKLYRSETKRVLISGAKIVREFPGPIDALIYVEPFDIAAQEHYLVTEEILKKISGLEHPDGCCAVVRLPSLQTNLSLKKRVLILDQIQDPGNLGNLLRSALAFGWEAVVATEGTVDFFNDKALRAAKGATFRLKLAYKTTQQLLDWIESDNVLFLAADAKGSLFSDFEKRVTPKDPIALLLGNEGQGPGSWTKNAAATISIPMQSQVESLNVAAAGAILLFYLKGDQ